MADHLRRLGLRFDSAVASALLYGIRIDTDDFSREVSEADFEAAATLLDRVDYEVLQQVESPSMTMDTIETIGRAIENRTVEAGILTSYVRHINDRDALAQAADLLLTMKGVTTTLVFGMVESEDDDDIVYVSARSRGADLDLGEALRDAFGQIGSAGGHADMAGAQIPLKSLWAFPVSSEETHHDIVEAVIAERFTETVDTWSGVGGPFEDESLVWDGGFPSSLFE
jgi:nanoRNase/pAp phosphatase (c-di-AMP/oligoRNAs hydrolase)